jgi:DNA-binding LytR/AlgR family response regulator
MIVNCVIIDDEPMARKLLQEYIEETDFLKLVGAVENPVKAMGLIKTQSVDLVFLDINMPKMTGMEFLRSSPNLPMVIMTTAYGQYALEGFEMAVIDYLVKPFSLDRFLKASQKALELKLLKHKAVSEDSAEPGHIYVKCDGKLARINFAELLYIEAMANYIVLYTAKEKFLVYLTIKGILEKLPPDNFTQVHKSTVVNIDKVSSIEGNVLTIADRKISMGLSFQEEAMKKILKDRFLKR